MIKGFLDGILAYGGTFKIISQMRLWIFLLVPGLISVVLGIAIFGTAWGLSGSIGDWLVSHYPWEWGKKVVEGISRLAGALFVIAIGLILFKHLVMAISAPIMSPLSEKVEKELTGSSGNVGFSVAQIVKDLRRGISIAIRNIIRELFFTFLLLLLSPIPLLGMLSPVLFFIIQAYYAGFGNMDYTLERHFNVRQSVHFVRANKGLAIGNGTVFLLLLLTGIGFLFALPLSTIAATTETAKRLP